MRSRLATLLLVVTPVSVALAQVAAPPEWPLETRAAELRAALARTLSDIHLVASLEDQVQRLAVRQGRSTPAEADARLASRVAELTASVPDQEALARSKAAYRQAVGDYFDEALKALGQAADAPAASSARSELERLRGQVAAWLDANLDPRPLVERASAVLARASGTAETNPFAGADERIFRALPSPQLRSLLAASDPGLGLDKLPLDAPPLAPGKGTASPPAPRVGVAGGTTGGPPLPEGGKVVGSRPADALEGRAGAARVADASEGRAAGSGSAGPVGGGAGGSGPAHAIEGAGTPTLEPAVECRATGPCIEQGTRLPLRILPRPLSHIYRDRTEAADAILKANVPAFRPLYVFAREGLDLRNPAAPRGWYRVGGTQQAAEGWMRAADVLEWRQALLVSYTHPGGVAEGRRPVLMFRDLSALRALAEAADRGPRAGQVYQRLEARDTPAELVSMEPKRFVDINKRFYLLPIIRYDGTEIGGDEVRYLQLAAAVPGKRGADTLEDPAYRDQAGTPRDAASQRLRGLRVNLVFVLDTTRSTQPYIDATKAAVAAMVKRLGEQPDLAGRLRFGLVGYRDSMARIPALEYTAKSFTPTLLEASAVVRLLDAEVKATEVGSQDYQEETFAGLDLALRAPWEEGALRFAVLIGDASSHPKGHPQNTTGKDADDLLLDAEQAQVHVYALHLKDSRAAEDHALAAEQFATLSRIRGSGESAVYAADAFQQAGFQQVVEAITARIVERLGGAVAAREGGAALGGATPGGGSPADQAAGLLDKVWESALVEYIGQDAQPPKDVIAWALDRDLVSPAERALEVRVLVSRQQLSSLVQALDAVVQAFMKAEVTQAQFFDALQAVAGQTMKRPEDIGQSARLSQSGLLPAFVNSLPYRSDVLSLSNERYASLTAEQRSALEWNLLTKLQQYRAINEQVDAWQRLNEGDADSEMVYPLHLDYLP